MGSLGPPWAPGAGLEWPYQAWGEIGMAAPGLGQDVFSKMCQQIAFFMKNWSKEVKKKVEIEGRGTPLARSAPQFCEYPRHKCQTRSYGDPIGDKNMGFGVPWGSGPS